MTAQIAYGQLFPGQKYSLPALARLWGVPRKTARTYADELVLAGKLTLHAMNGDTPIFRPA